MKKKIEIKQLPPVRFLVSIGGKSAKLILGGPRSNMTSKEVPRSIFEKKARFRL